MSIDNLFECTYEQSPMLEVCVIGIVDDKDLHRIVCKDLRNEFVKK